jgi:hypothetical protein
MKYKKLLLLAYNEEPDGPLPWKDCFHVTASFENEGLIYSQLLKRVIEPMFSCLHNRLIPDMPSIESRADLIKLEEWERTYFGAP